MNKDLSSFGFQGKRESEGMIIHTRGQYSTPQRDEIGGKGMLILAFFIPWVNATLQKTNKKQTMVQMIESSQNFLVKVVSQSWATIVDGCHLFAASRKPIIKPLTHLCIPKNTLDSFLAGFGKNWKVSACFYVTNNFCKKCYVDLHLHTLTQPLI